MRPTGARAATPGGGDGFDTRVTDRLLTTTRSVRRRLDLTRPIAVETVLECLEIASQAPASAGNGPHWILVTDPRLRAGLADLYRRACRPRTPGPGAAMSAQQRSEAFLAEHLAEVPVLLVPCLPRQRWQVTSTHTDLVNASVYGSIYPAVWSFQLAARTRGLGSCFTAAHLRYAEQAARLLAIPGEVVQGGLVAVAATSGPFRPAARAPLSQTVHTNTWTQLPAGLI